MSSDEARWFANYFDMHGRVSFSNVGNGHGIRVNRLTVNLHADSQDDAEVLQVLVGCGTIRYLEGRNVRELSLSCRQARRFLTDILEFLVLKNQLVTEALERDRALVVPHGEYA